MEPRDNFPRSLPKPPFPPTSALPFPFPFSQLRSLSAAGMLQLPPPPPPQARRQPWRTMMTSGTLSHQRRRYPALAPQTTGACATTATGLELAPLLARGPVVAECVCGGIKSQLLTPLMCKTYKRRSGQAAHSCKQEY
jgi:hypothetical protein